jgi:hypothetical protein
MAAVVFFVVLAFLSLWALFQIIRLAVRYGVSDAIRMNPGTSFEVTIGRADRSTDPCQTVVRRGDQAAGSYSSRNGVCQSSTTRGLRGAVGRRRVPVWSTR